MSHTPTSAGQAGNVTGASAAPNQTAQQDKKPSLTGVRIKQRKGQAKATAKFEPESECTRVIQMRGLIVDVHDSLS